MVANKFVHFERYQDGELWYATEDGFEFPIPTEDMKGATFLAQDKAIFYMRWIRRWISKIEKERNDSLNSNENV